MIRETEREREKKGRGTARVSTLRRIGARTRRDTYIRGRSLDGDGRRQPVVASEWWGEERRGGGNSDRLLVFDSEENLIDAR